MIVDESGYGVDFLSPSDNGEVAFINVALLHGGPGPQSISLPIEYSAVDRLVVELLALREAHTDGQRVH